MQLEFKNISLQLGGKQLFKEFNLKVKSGEKILLKGPSGSGKSSLMRLALGFVQPGEGEVRIDGEKLDSQNVWSFRQRIAFVPQNQTIGSGTVKDFICDILEYRANRHLKYTEEQMLTCFKQFDLEANKLHQDISKLSGGEKQRVVLVLALLLDRELYLLDEVTSAIDEALRHKVINHLAGLPEKTMIVISHDHDWEAYDFKKIQLKSPNL